MVAYSESEKSSAFVSGTLFKKLEYSLREASKESLKQSDCILRLESSVQHHKIRPELTP